MAQIKVTLEQMRTYVRSLDERVADTTKYPDSWCDSRINTAYEVIATRRQPWLNEEVLDLNPYIDDGTSNFQVDMELDVIGYKRIFTNDPSYIDEYNPGITWTVRPDNIVDVFLDISRLNSDNDNNMTFQYYYIPTIPVEETYMSADVYHMLRHGMEFSVYETLRDMEKFAWAEKKIEDSATSVTNGLDIDIYPRDQWNGGFFV